VSASGLNSHGTIPIMDRAFCPNYQGAISMGKTFISSSLNGLNFMCAILLCWL